MQKPSTKARKASIDFTSGHQNIQGRFYKEALDVARNRLIVAGILFVFILCGITGRLVYMGLVQEGGEPLFVHDAVRSKYYQGRSNILDRNGIVLATTVTTSSLFANAKKVLDPETAATMLAEALPGFSRDKLLKKLKSDRPFIWLARHLTPKQRDKIIHLGIPGVAFRKDSKRLYPQGRLVAHVVGLTNVDDQGIAGLEKSQEQFLRTQGVDLTLSIDVRIQHAIRHELQKGMEEFQATGAAAIVLDMETEEILGMVSLPDFNPNHDVRVTDPGYFNKATVGMYEMGSTFKLINTANGLQSGLMTLSSKYDTSAEVKIGRFTITDYRANHGVISVAEILVHSSNKGSVRILQALGKERQQAFIEKLGCLGRCSIELPERGFPIIPRHWRDANAMTISYGYGIAVSPLHLLNAGATILGDGCRKNATLLKRGNEPRQCERVVDESVASKMRQLARYVVLYGTSKKANVPGYFLAAKTGTRNMLEANGHYNKNRVSTSFIGLIGDALGKPRYMVVAILEDPKASKKTYGFTTSGWNVAPVAGRILARVASITGLKPKPEQLEEGFDPFLKTLNFVKKT